MANITANFSQERRVGEVNMCEVDVTVNGRKANFTVQGYTDAAERKALVVEKLRELKRAGALNPLPTHPDLPKSTSVSDSDLEPAG